MSSYVDNPGVESRQIAEGKIVAILPEAHPLATQPFVTVAELAQHDLIGVDPNDPYGKIMAQPFRDAGIEPHYAIRGRFAQTVVSLVRHGLGVALIDEFSVAEVYMPGLVRRPVQETLPIRIYVVNKKGRVMSNFSEEAIAQFGKELAEAHVHWAEAMQN